MDKLTLEDLPRSAIAKKRALVRVDFNVPIEDGRVADDTRIRASLPTLKFLGERGARTILVSHLGRPKGKWAEEFSLEPVATHLRSLVSTPVQFVPDIVGAEAHAAVDALPPAGILLLENVRFLPGEETDDPKLSEALAAFADVYVNDAFGSAHRAHASTCGVAEVVKAEGKPAVAGLLMERELQFLGDALSDPQRPFIAILGGAKISGKIDVIAALLPRVDRLLIGGAMANTFFLALGLQVGRSLVEEDRLPLARKLLEQAGAKLVLPVDCVVASEAKVGEATLTVERDNVPAEMRILDIGPKTVATFSDLIEASGTVLWNGPMGLFETPEFADGTRGVARALVAATKNGATTIAGGGDTAAALEDAGLADRLTHVSTGGGASLEFLEGRVLPGVAVLSDRPRQ
jgi:phosphoglycerate kinase